MRVVAVDGGFYGPRFLFRRSVVTYLRFVLVILVSWTLGTGGAAAAQGLKPFVLAARTAPPLEAAAAQVKAKLQRAGFQVVGDYAPYEGARVLGVTSDALLKAAARSTFGGYGAVQRVALTQVGGEVQVTYTNPVYMAHAYRMASDLREVAQALEEALGRERDFGSREGLSAKALRKYHYMLGMEYFDDPSVLGRFPSHAAALAAVEAGLAQGRGGVHKVYRVDIPGKEESVFGVRMTEGCSADRFIMGHIDFKPLRSTAHLPYEILVAGDTAYALYARFRIAINFPDLKMVGANSFFKIMCAPDAIEEALTRAVGGREGESDEIF